MPTSQAPIPKNLGGTDYLYEDLPVIGNVRLSDAAVVAVPIFIGFSIVDSLPAELSFLSIPIYLLMAFVSFALLKVKPSYMSLTEVLVDYKYFRLDKIVTFDKDTQPLQELIQEGSGSEDTRQKVGLDRMYPQYGVAKPLDEDSVVSIVKFEGKNMDMQGMGAEVDSNIQEFKKFLNDRLDTDIQLYLPKRQYDPSRQVQALQNRKGDPDVREEEGLQLYLEERIQFHRNLSERGFYRQYYVVIKTDPDEVISGNTYNKTGMERLAENDPTNIIENVYTYKERKSKRITPSESRYRQVVLARQKADEIGQQMSKFAGDYHVLDGREYLAILKEFWNSETITKEESEGLMRTKPYVTESQESNDDEDQIDSQTQSAIEQRIQQDEE